MSDYSKHKYNNHVIEALTCRHGKNILEFWLEQGIDCENFGGNCTKETYDDDRWYGIINGHFTNFDEHQVKSSNAKIIDLDEVTKISKAELYHPKVDPKTFELIKSNNKSNNKSKQNENGNSIKVQKVITEITSGQGFSGIGISGKRSEATITVGCISNQTVIGH
jgi:hypothetical protein